MEHEVAAQNSRNRSRGAETWHQHTAWIAGESSGCKHMSQGSKHAAQKIESQVTEVPQTIFDVVTKDPKEEHVARNVCDAAMHKHRGKKRYVYGRPGSTEARHQQSLSRNRNHHMAVSHCIAAGQDLPRHC